MRNYVIFYLFDIFGGSQKGGSERVVLADVPGYQKPGRGYIRMFPDTKNRNEGTFAKAPFTKPPFCFPSKLFGVATPAEPRGENKLFFVQILGGEKLLKFVEKCRWNIFKRPDKA